jgi:hypothetical protein
MKKTVAGLVMAGVLMAGGYATTSFATNGETSAETGKSLNWNFKGQIWTSWIRR